MGSYHYCEKHAKEVAGNFGPTLKIDADGSEGAVMGHMLWEYTCETFDGFTDLSKKLNNLGNDGWEVIAVLPKTETMPNTIIAKRPNEKAWSRPEVAVKGE
jgi:hypothetical protein